VFAARDMAAAQKHMGVQWCGFCVDLAVDVNLSTLHTLLVACACAWSVLFVLAVEASACCAWGRCDEYACCMERGMKPGAFLLFEKV
jgi:hypothetical protein